MKIMIGLFVQRRFCKNCRALFALWKSSQSYQEDGEIHPELQLNIFLYSKIDLE